MTQTAKKQLSALGILIRNLREERNITQKTFAERLGTTQSAVARIEGGEQNVSAGLLARISEILGKNVIQVSDGAINVEIEGGYPLSGSVVTKTSKNAAMGLLAASLLNKSETMLFNVPKIEEVHRMIEVLQSIGVSVKWNQNSLSIKPPTKFRIEDIDATAAQKTRSILMLIGSLIHISKAFSIPHPGGCKLGSRTVRPHFYALENFGVKIKTSHTNYIITTGAVKQHEIILYESGDTVTENVLMAAARIPETTVIKYASANYQVQEMCFFLRKLGVQIDGIGTSTLTVRGVSDIDVPVSYAISEDPIDSMFMLSAAIVTKSRITITRCPIDFLEVELLKLKKMGFKYRIGKRYKSQNGNTDLVDIETIPSELRALEEKIHPSVYPGLNIDNLPFFAVIATQAKGQTFIHDWVYENRAIHYKELDKLGAEIILADAHRVYITGPVELKANEIICPPALRPAAIILIGMLAVKGRSVLRNIYSINRGYEDIIDRLNQLGAHIKIL
ncbi:MAG: UDP-N-acetylglucosamine 1-carboxyvinyltransferase [Candidatus Taylorbacteria bacterium RIFCSPHIGHO2_01_FULL_46_22b]|uniref:UDP-N-acetylglucosamine 1-carboxyvinyltransferase n=1 Tax=Candidatus Taylorbacteria bacterium RIFCSPHIGHO2_01_FULL_46_22b TaxID=1802301 RepID=A0A1G2M455_9BACT|nr:MAG: UDP-N-acetylglucosamine 1-carboxyvinyltransferase [Candidatus Taylorbacteria bacterium RIFCSPHIGHO2_01_FULL_46_22b]